LPRYQFNDDLFEGEKGKDIILIDHALLNQIGVFSPVTGRETLNTSTISPSDIGLPLHLPVREKKII
jgi:hypothetical protein